MASSLRNKVELSIVVPCFNEEKNVPLVLSSFKRAIGRKNIEVVMVDNGSTDRTGKVLRELLPNYPFAKMVVVKKNIGYGWGILTGLKASSGEFLGWTHADMQTDPKDVIKSLQIIKNAGFKDNLFVKGLRHGRPLFDRIFSALMGLYVSIYLGKVFREINAQPTVFSRKFYQSFKNPPKDFSLDLYVYYLAKHTKQDIIRFDVFFPKRIHGESSWNTSFKSKFKLTLRAMRYTKELKNKMRNDIYSS